MRIIPTFLFSLALSMPSCGSTESGPPAPCDGSSSSASSSGDPNPANECKGPGKGGGGDPCLTACDCCLFDCRILTDPDGSMSGVCSGDCAVDAGTTTRD